MRSKWTSSETGFVAQVGLILLCASLGATAVNDSAYEQELSQQRQTLSSSGTALRANLEITMGNLLRIAQSMRATIEARPDITQEEFSYVAARLVNEDRAARGHPEIINIGAAPDLVLRLIYPLERNRAVLGLDYRTLEKQLPAVEAAMQSRRAVVSGPIELVQGGTAMLIRISISPFGAAEPWGIVSVVVDRDELFRNAGLVPQIGEIDFAVIRDFSQDTLEQSFGIISGNAAVLDRDPVVLDVVLPGVRWKLYVVPADGWLLHSSSREMLWMSFAAFSAVLVGIMELIRRVQRRKRFAERKLAQAIGAIDDGFAMYGSDDRLIICNDKYRQYYPKSAAKMTPGTSFREILEYGLEQGEYSDALGRESEWLEERLTAHRVADYTVIQELTNGRWLKISEARLEDGGTVGFRVDITEIVRAREAAERSDNAKSVFLNQMSHELRTPLAIMLGYNAFLRKPECLYSATALKTLAQKPEYADIAAPFADLANEVSRNAEKVDASGRNLLAMIDSIIEFAISEKVMTEQLPEEIDIGRLLNTVGAPYLTQDANRGVTTIIRSGSAWLSVDAERIRRALNCLFRHGTEVLAKGTLTVALNDNGATIDVVFDSVGEFRDGGLTISVFEGADAPSDNARPATYSLDLGVVERLFDRSDARLTVMDFAPNHKRVVMSLTCALAADPSAQRNTVRFGTAVA